MAGGLVAGTLLLWHAAGVLLGMAGGWTAKGVPVWGILVAVFIGTASMLSLAILVADQIARSRAGAPRHDRIQDWLLFAIGLTLMGLVLVLVAW